jgi:hypothetical protein
MISENQYIDHLKKLHKMQTSTRTTNQFTRLEQSHLHAKELRQISLKFHKKC